LYCGVVGFALSMKFNFKIKTEPTLRALVIISIVACCSGSLAYIVVYLNNPTTGIYCATILVVMDFFALCYPFH
jgi:hypothetical protein